MKRASFILILCLAAGSAFAHSPSDIKAVYDKDNQLITITVSHPVGDPKGHYVDLIEVKKGDKVVFKQIYEGQFDPQQQVAYLVWPGQIEELKIKSSAKCNKFGQKEKVFNLKAP